jgi:hypothetical protein
MMQARWVTIDSLRRRREWEEKEMVKHRAPLPENPAVVIDLCIENEPL